MVSACPSTVTNKQSAESKQTADMIKIHNFIPNIFVSFFFLSFIHTARAHSSKQGILTTQMHQLHAMQGAIVRDKGTRDDDPAPALRRSTRPSTRQTLEICDDTYSIKIHKTQNGLDIDTHTRHEISKQNEISTAK